MLPKLVLRLVPTLLTALMMITETAAATRQYSIAVAPDSALRKATILDMAVDRLPVLTLHGTVVSLTKS
jgi:hypothetical protein